MFNIYNLFLEKLRPVLVYIHGGAFMFGSGSACWYGPEFWMIHDIIVVTFNYRLGPLGKPIPALLLLRNLLSLLPFSLLPFAILPCSLMPLLYWQSLYSHFFYLVICSCINIKIELKTGLSNYKVKIICHAHTF